MQQSRLFVLKKYLLYTIYQHLCKCPFIYAIVNLCMNFNNNTHRINSSIVKTINFKAMNMGILLIATLVVVNTYGIAFAQAGYNVAGCAHTVKVTIYNLPGQTAKSDTQATLSNVDQNKDKGDADINIPGIGSGHLEVSYFANNGSGNPTYNTIITGLQGQTTKDDDGIVTAGDVCYPSANTLPDIISVPGIGAGYLTISIVN